MNESVIIAKSLTRRYGDAVAVDGLSFEVARGEVFGLLGPNGAGKTTTILMLLGLTPASAGSVRVLGLDPQRTPLAVKEKVGYMPDSVGFYDGLSARENLGYTAKLLGIRASERSQRVEEALARVRLTGVADRPTGTFSHGMKRRLGLAEIVMKRASIAILDEPTSGLDPQSTEEFLELVAELQSDGVTILLSSHLLDQVQRICNRVALFNAGSIALIGSVSELAEQTCGSTHRVRLQARGPELGDALRQIDGVTEVNAESGDSYLLLAHRDVRPDAAKVAVDQGALVLSLSVDAPSLETIYKNYFDSTGAKA